MKVRTHHLAASLFAGAIFLSSVAWFSVYTPAATATCSGGANIMISNPPAGAILSGNFFLAANSPASPAPSGVTFVISAPTTRVIGQAYLNTGTATGGESQWKYQWDTLTIENGNYQLSAIAHYGDNTALDCNSAPVAITIQNSPTSSPPPTTQTPTLAVAISPNPWQGSPKQQQKFTVSGTYKSENGTHYALSSIPDAQYVWDTRAGAFSPNGQAYTVLTAGSILGNFAMGVNVTVNGITSRATAPIKLVTTSTATVSPSPSATPESSTNVISPSPSPSKSPIVESGMHTQLEPLSAQEVERLSNTPTVFRPKIETNSRPIVAVSNLACLEKKLGARYIPISSGVDTASSAERRLGSVCFSGSAKIPAALAPVEPTRISEVPTTTSIVTLASTKNQITTNKSGDKINSILISGTAAPNSDVFVYIFSDPMVLRAQSDKAGKWNYVLQNPLKPGDHEIYAVAAKDSNSFVRTSALPISIASAAPGSQDGSLVIESKWKPEQVMYVVAAVLMVMIAIFLLFRLRRTGAHSFAGVDMVHPGMGPDPVVFHPESATMYAAPKATSEATQVIPTSPTPPAPATPPTPEAKQ